MPTKPYSPACEQNGQVILQVLCQYLQPGQTVLEIGSGTGQHAVKFAAAMPDIIWQPSDRQVQHPGMQLWLDEADLPNICRPLVLDVLENHWPDPFYDAVFSANTAHIMSLEMVQLMFTGVSRCLLPGSYFLLYGPFSYHGQHISQSNHQFDLWLREQDPKSGVRDVAWLTSVAQPMGLSLAEDVVMPANNRILVWRRNRDLKS